MADLINDLEAQDPAWANEYNDGNPFHGDCEDYAVLRHALLRALSFDRDFVWNVSSPGHQFNAVLYNGAYRIMDYGYMAIYYKRNIFCSPILWIYSYSYRIIFTL